MLFLILIPMLVASGSQRAIAEDAAAKAGSKAPIALDPRKPAP